MSFAYVFGDGFVPTITACIRRAVREYRKGVARGEGGSNVAPLEESTMKRLFTVVAVVVAATAVIACSDREQPTVPKPAQPKLFSQAIHGVKFAVRIEASAGSAVLPVPINGLRSMTARVA